MVEDAADEEYGTALGFEDKRVARKPVGEVADGGGDGGKRVVDRKVVLVAELEPPESVSFDHSPRGPLPHGVFDS